eukprot:TRINITY_DN19429_c0_g1_i2.p1 TRINITY_DN19429_c0_g1~~TRINITY_DN19429_c0_g1_i2.p1  ORF type:complete len:701 (-),score=123.32 TRINITY_DN19429_c0_g1_i2:16-2118(-)
MLQLLGQVQVHCRELVTFLLAGLTSQEGGPGVACDRLWTLRSIARRSDLARRWIEEGGGIAAVAAAMDVHRGDLKVQKEGAWLCYAIAGLDGFVELLRLSRGKPIAQIAVAWAFDDVRCACREWPNVNAGVLVLLEAMRERSPDAPNEMVLELVWACCVSLKTLIDSQACRSTFFVEHGGDEAVLAALRFAHTSGDAGQSALVATMQLLGSLVEGNAAAAQRLRARGTLDILVDCGIRMPDHVASETMWTIGHIGGMLAVLQVMSKAPDSESVLQTGLRVLKQLAWKDTTDVEEGLQQQLPQAAQALAGLVRQVAAVERPADDIIMAIQALGGVIHMLAPHVAPGTWPVADDAVAVLIQAVGRSSQELMAQAAAASLGHIGVSAPKWRRPLRAALPDLQHRMREPSEREDGMKHQKCLFWASAAIAGLPSMLEEMRKQPSSANVQEAAICAINDVLEFHGDGELVSDDGDVYVEPESVPEAMTVVASALRAHRTSLDVQWAGCYALGALSGLLPANMPLPPDAIEGVLAALRRHHMKYKVAACCSSSLRSFLEPRRGSREGSSPVARVAAELRSREAAKMLRNILTDYALSTDPKLLADTLYALGLVEGSAAVLQVLAASEKAHASTRLGGLRALVDLVRAFPDFLAGQRPEEIRAVLDALGADVAVPVDGALDEAGAELLRNLELLRGLLGYGSSPPRS